MEMKKFLGEFKTFIMRGNVLDMAVGVVVGGAFTAIVNSVVNDLLMPLLSLLTGRINFADLYIALDGKTYESLSAAKEVSAPVFAYGSFIQALIQFLIISFAVFVLIKGINALHTKKDEPAPEPTTKKCPYCMTEIDIKATRCPHCTSELTEAK